MRRANASVMAVYLAAGFHELTFEYSEPALAIGFGISVSALLFCLMLFVVGPGARSRVDLGARS